MKTGSGRQVGRSKNSRLGMGMRNFCLSLVLSGSVVGLALGAVTGASVVHVKHVFVVVEENQNFSQVIGNRAMPYLNGLATTYAYSAGYYANTHPSMPNYFMLTAGKLLSTGSTVTDDNIVRHLLAAGKTWKEYSEGLPYAGYIGKSTGNYDAIHNPLSYFSDVRNSASQELNLVPFTQLAVDIKNHTLPKYGFIVPDDENNSHDCPPTIPNCSNNQALAVADAWLEKNIDPLLHSADFNVPGGGVLIITFDEAAADNTHGGGQVAWVVVGPNVRNRYVSHTFYRHESTLRFMSELIGLNKFPGAAATAPDMAEFMRGN